MNKAYTRDEIKEVILQKTDIAKLLKDMIKNDEINPDALTNPHAKDENGKCTIHVDLRSSGTIGIVCPFHETESNTGCKINREGDRDSKKPHPYLHCFVGGCPANEGTIDAIALYMVLHFNLDPNRLYQKGYGGKEFHRTLKILAKKIGIEYDDEKRELSAEELAERKRIEIRRKAADLYHSAIFKHERKNSVMRYMLKDRGFEKAPISFHELIKKYKLGFAPVEWDNEKKQPIRNWLYTQLCNQYTDEELIDSGVVWKNLSDALNGFVIPYWSGNGINNLYARNIYAKKKNDHSDSKGKKRDMRHLRLHGGVDVPINFDIAKNFEDIILVEGEISWLSLIALGFENTVGNRGTGGLKPRHLELFKEERENSKGKNCKNFYICFDPDEAGINATLRDGERLTNEGFEVFVINLANGDPNDFLVSGGTKENFVQLKEEALSFDAYKVLYIVGNKPYQTDAQRLAALRQARPYIQKMYSDERLLIAHQVAQKLGIDVKELKNAWENYELVPGLNEVLKTGKSWIWLMDDLSMFEIFSSKFHNVLYMQNLEEERVIQQLQKAKTITTIFVNSHMDTEKKKKLKEKLPGVDFAEIPADNYENYKEIDRREIMNYLREVS